MEIYPTGLSKKELLGAGFHSATGRAERTGELFRPRRATALRRLYIYDRRSHRLSP